VPNLPEPPPSLVPIPEIQPGDRVLGGTDGAANKQAIALMSRTGAVLQAAQDAAAMAQAAAQTATAAATTATNAANAATTAQNAATAATTTANAANVTAGTADATATTALNTARQRSVRIDLPDTTITYSALIAVGAGARTLIATCQGAQVGDAIFVSPSATVPDGYAVASCQCLQANQIRVSVVHPALALAASFSIPLKVYALRSPTT
jgi:hypothetical protein